MRVIFIYPDILKGAGWSGYYYSGIAYLAAAAKRAGHDAVLLHVTRPVSEEQFLEMVRERVNGDSKALIAFSSTTNMFFFVKQWSAWIKQYYSNTIIVGGIHPTLNPEDTIGTKWIDAVCVGEGEAPLVEFLDAMENGKDQTSIPNIWVKREGDIFKNPCRPLLKDLDELPFPDRGIFDYENLDCERRGIGVFMASRGCPYDCFYCCNHAIKEVVGACGYVRFRSVDNVLREIRQVVDAHPFITFVHFDDDILPIRKKWFEDFSERYSREIGLPFECNIRANLVNEGTIKLLHQAGCSKLRLGIESGNSFIRDKILNRNLSQESLIGASRLCKSAGIGLYTFNMVGLPSEDMAARLETIKFNVEIDSDEQQVSIFYPFEKTKLFEICKEHGLIREKEVADPFRDTSLSFGRLERNQIVFTAYYFTVLVRLYKFYQGLTASMSAPLCAITDRILISRASALLMFPFLNSLVRFLSRHRQLEVLARKIKYRLIKAA